MIFPFGESERAGRWACSDLFLVWVSFCRMLSTRHEMDTTPKIKKGGQVRKTEPQAPTSRSPNVRGMSKALVSQNTRAAPPPVQAKSRASGGAAAQCGAGGPGRKEAMGMESGPPLAAERFVAFVLGPPKKRGNMVFLFRFPLKQGKEGYPQKQGQTQQPLETQTGRLPHLPPH